jgi:hypothetical protein
VLRWEAVAQGHLTAGDNSGEPKPSHPGRLTDFLSCPATAPHNHHVKDEGW